MLLERILTFSFCPENQNPPEEHKGVLLSATKEDEVTLKEKKKVPLIKIFYMTK